MLLSIYPEKSIVSYFVGMIVYTLIGCGAQGVIRGAVMQCSDQETEGATGGRAKEE